MEYLSNWSVQADSWQDLLACVNAVAFADELGAVAAFLYFLFLLIVSFPLFGCCWFVFITTLVTGGQYSR